MIKQNTANKRINQDEQASDREKIEITIRKLQTLKDKVSELKRQCKELKGLNLENKPPSRCECRNAVEPNQKIVENKAPLRCRCGNAVEPSHQVVENRALLCNECGKAIEPSHQVVVKDSAGVEKRHYHMKCFQAMLK